MSDWVKAREFPSRLEAEMAFARLQSAHIPGVMRSHEGGFFGPAFQGVVPTGVDLLVPKQRLSDAQELLQAD